MGVAFGNMQNHKIENVVFDLGKVLLDFNFRSSVEYLVDKGALANLEFFKRAGVVEFECGKISPREFLERVAEITPEPIDLDHLQNLWMDIFTPDEQMIELAKTLRGNYKTFILSNTNELHWGHVTQAFGVHNWVDGALPSHEAGYVKPDQRIYQTLLERFSLVPEKTIFIDDLAENIEAAQDCGIKGIHHTGYSDTLEQLKKFGVTC